MEEDKKPKLPPEIEHARIGGSFAERLEIALSQVKDRQKLLDEAGLRYKLRKLHPDDPGNISFAVGATDDDKIILILSEKLDWLTMRYPHAKMLAESILSLVEEMENQDRLRNSFTSN